MNATTSSVKINWTGTIALLLTFTLLVVTRYFWVQANGVAVLVTGFLTLLAFATYLGSAARVWKITI